MIIIVVIFITVAVILSLSLQQHLKEIKNMGKRNKTETLARGGP